MAYTIEMLSDEPIIFMDVAEFNIGEDLRVYFDDILTLLNEQREKVVLITDCRDLKLDFSGLVEGLGVITQGNTLASHPNTGRIMVVSGSKLIRMAAKALGQNQYGSISVDIFETPEAALAAARAG